LRGGLVHTPDKLELQDPNRVVGDESYRPPRVLKREIVASCV
jgi:hypothetical protein